MVLIDYMIKTISLTNLALVLVRGIVTVNFTNHDMFVLKSRPLNLKKYICTHLWIVNQQWHSLKFTSRWWSSRCSSCSCSRSGGSSRPWCWTSSWSAPPTSIDRTENESNKKCSKKFHFFYLSSSIFRNGSRDFKYFWYWTLPWVGFHAQIQRFYIIINPLVFILERITVCKIIIRQSWDKISHTTECRRTLILKIKKKSSKNIILDSNFSKLKKWIKVLSWPRVAF